MEKNEIDRLVNLRKFLISHYSRLEKGKFTTTDNKDVAVLIESIVREVDGVLSSHVKFEK